MMRNLAAAVVAIAAFVVSGGPALGGEPGPSGEPDLGLALLEQVGLTPEQRPQVAALRAALFRDLAPLQSALAQRQARPVSPLVAWRNRQQAGQVDTTATGLREQILERQLTYRRAVLDLLTPQQRLAFYRLIRSYARGGGGGGAGADGRPSARQEQTASQRRLDLGQDRAGQAHGEGNGGGERDAPGRSGCGHGSPWIERGRGSRTMGRDGGSGRGSRAV